MIPAFRLLLLASPDAFGRGQVIPPAPVYFFMSKESLIYFPAPELRKDFDRRLREFVGLCPISEPGIRFVWGCDRKKFYGGTEQHVYIDPNGKYVGLPYYVAEVWSPETVYDRKEWEASRYGMLIKDVEYSKCSLAQPNPCCQHFGGYGFHQKCDLTIDVLGPFPEKGVWDFLKICRRDDFSPMTAEEMLDLAREWKHNGTRPQATRRAIEDYMRFNDMVLAIQERAFEEAKSRDREEMAKELTKADSTKPKFSFETAGTPPKAKNIASAGH